jgi:hypothetical protein
MAKTNPDNATDAAPDLHSIPIGNPPGGGRWTWGVEKQEWISLDLPEVQAMPLTPTPLDAPE